MAKIAIIGAGISGAACGQALKKAGHEVALFDKGRGPGGRMSTRRVALHGREILFDHGAQYFTVRDPDFQTQIQQLNKAGFVAPWEFEPLSFVRLKMDHSVQPLTDETIYVGLPGMNGVVRGLCADLNVFWGVRVESILPVTNGFDLISEQGTHLGQFNLVVCAVPAEQVSSLIDPIAPEFANKSRSINSLPCWAGMFAFERPLCIPFHAMQLEDHPVVDFINLNDSKPGRDRTDFPASYVVHAHAQWSIDHLEDSPEAVAAALADALIGFSDDRPKLVFSTAHRWRYARVEVKNGPQYLWDATSNLGVCGDWLYGPRVESAWLSGHKLGLEIAKSLRAGG